MLKIESIKNLKVDYVLLILNYRLNLIYLSIKQFNYIRILYDWSHIRSCNYLDS